MSKIEQDLERFSAIAESIQGEYIWTIVSKSDVDYQISAFPQACKTLFPDLTAVAFKKDTPVVDIIRELESLIQQMKEHVKDKPDVSIASSGKDKFEVGLGI